MASTRARATRTARSRPDPLDQRRRPRKTRVTPQFFAFAGLGVGLFLLALFLLKRGGGGAPEDAAPQAAAPAAAPASGPPAASADPLQHPAVQRLRYLRANLLNYNTEGVRSQLDLPAWYAAEAGERAPAWTALPAVQKEQFGRDLVQRLSGDPELRRFAELELSSAAVDAAEGDQLHMTLRCGADPDSLWRFRFTSGGGEWRVAGCQRDSAAALAAAEQDQQAAAVQTAEERYIAQNFVVTDEGARVYKGEVAKVELVAGTSDAEVKRIQDLLKKTLSEDGLESRTARRELRGIGHKAVPVLLNRLVELPLNDDPQRVQEVAALDRLLQDITGRESAFPLPSLSPEPPDKLRERQQIALDGWFGWWQRWGERWEAWREEQGLPAPEPDPRRPRGSQ